MCDTEKKHYISTRESASKLLASVAATSLPKEETRATFAEFRRSSYRALTTMANLYAEPEVNYKHERPVLVWRDNGHEVLLSESGHTIQVLDEDNVDLEVFSRHVMSAFGLLLEYQDSDKSFAEWVDELLAHHG